MVKAKGNRTRRTTGPKEGAASKRNSLVSSEDRKERIEGILDSIEKKLLSTNYKASLGDYIRLLQLQLETEDEMPGGIEVTWIEPPAENRA